MNADTALSIPDELCHCGRGRDHHVDAHRPGPDLMDGGVTAALIEEESRELLRAIRGTGVRHAKDES